MLYGFAFPAYHLFLLNMSRPDFLILLAFGNGGVLLRASISGRSVVKESTSAQEWRGGIQSDQQPYRILRS